jgi:60 kDa SS-A/Ro ribonucleoprotein
MTGGGISIKIVAFILQPMLQWEEVKMANKNIFSGKNSPISKETRNTDTVNEAGGKAYEFGPEHALAQLAATGCLNTTYYASGQDQLDKVLELAKKVEPRFLAQVAIFARERGYMKDMPALICSILAKRDVSLLRKVFPRVIDNGKMLRNFVQIIRSGKAGRKSLGTAPKTLIQEWLNSRDDKRLLEASVGNDPSLADIIKLTHPKPKNATRNAFYGWLLDREYSKSKLPEIVKQYEDYKQNGSGEVPEVPFQLLTALTLGKNEWIEIAKNMKWHATRMNLNTLQRHGVFEDNKMVSMIAERLRDPEQVRKSKVFPYQLMMAYQNTVDVPNVIREALQDAMEIATENIPEIEGKVFIFPDVSGSMSSPVTGHRGSATTKVSCLDVAALFAASMIRRNREATIIPFAETVRKFNCNPRDSVMTIAEQLRKVPGGGTNCSAALAEINRMNAKADLIVYISDNESWVDSNRGYGGQTNTMTEWNRCLQRNPKAKMVCIDIQAYDSTQAHEREDIMNIGGFSDEIFSIIAEFAKGDLNSKHWVGEIERITL